MESLRRLAEDSKRNWDILEAINALDAHDVERIRAIPQVAELSTFLQQMQTHNPVRR